MAKQTDTAIVLSDSDDDEAIKKSRSPLTSVKPRKVVVVSTARSKDTKVQTKLSSFFNTVALPRNSAEVSISASCLISRHTNGFKCSKVADLKLSPLKASSSFKRLALKGMSPPAKIIHTAKTERIYNLKGKELLKAFAPGKFEEQENERILPAEPAVDDIFENAFKFLDSWDSEVTPDTFMESVSKQLAEPLPERMQLDEELSTPAPIIKPMSNLTIKRNRPKSPPVSYLVIESPATTRGEQVFNTSTPMKCPDISTDLFSDDSLLSDLAVIGSSPLYKDYGRHVVLDCSQGESNTIMMLKDMDGVTKSCELQGFWADLKIKVGDIVNISGQFDEINHMVIDMQKNMIVINPDFLVSGSVIASATTCVRRSVLNDRYKGYDAGSKYMLLGNILHEVFQKALLANVQVPVAMRKLAQDVTHCSRYAHDMYLNNNLV